MNKQLQKKLLSYSALATALLAVEKSADAQIVYHEVDYSIYPPGYYFMDLNSDGIYDFNFNCSFWYTLFQTSFTGGTYYKPHFRDNLIGIDSNRFGRSFQSQSAIVKSNSVNRSDFIISSQTVQYYDGYLPLKFIASGNTYMGWVRLNTTDFPYFKIISYAYELTPSDSIIIGDVGCNHIPITPTITMQGNDTLISTSSNKYQWYLNGTLLATDTTQSIVSSQNGVYSVITTDTEGCKTISNGVNFIPCDSVKLNITSNTTYGCDSTYLYIKLDSLPYGYSIRWYNSTQNITTSTGTSYFEYLYNSDYFYAICYNPLTECYDTSNTININIYYPPTIPIVTQEGDTLISSVKGNYIYTWFNDTTLIPNADSSYYVTKDTGSYIVEVAAIGDNGCSSYSTPFSFVTTNIYTLSSKGQIKVYTNDDNIYINFSSQDFLNGTIELYNIEGQELQQQTINSSTEILKAQQLAKGIYFVAITKNGVRKVYKIALV